jgi:hypothetical protein
MATEAQVPDPDVPKYRPMRGANEVRDWWHATAQDDVVEVLAKLSSYGSLNFHAQCMLTLVGRPYGSMREGSELAIASYIAGKLNRLLDGLSRGELPSEDSWADLSRYAMMARYVRKYGEWP